MTTTLPTWNLSDLYEGLHDRTISQDLKRAEELATQFEQKYKGKVTSLNGDALAAAIVEYEAMDDVLGRLISYAYLKYAEDTSSPETLTFYQNIMENTNEINIKFLFFVLEINRIHDEKLEHMLERKSLARYAPWIRNVRVIKPYQLSDELETLLHEKSITSSQIWIRFFDETLADLRFDYQGESVPVSDILNAIHSHKAKDRKEAAKSLGKTLRDYGKQWALILNTLAKDKSIEDKWRGYASPISSRNVSNFIEDDVVEALLSTVRGEYKNLSHRYYLWKAKQFGQDALDYWDRNAPLPNEPETSLPFEDAKDIVLEAYGNFSPLMRELGEQFFLNRWIDAKPKKGKDSGAFSHPVVPSVHPYILMNYYGKIRDVMTLAHELGHGVHQLLARKQGALMCDTPLTLAETASVFGEQLAFQELLSRQKNPEEKKSIIAGKTEDMLNTVVRQVAFCEFERMVHDERRSGELSAERICDLWMQVQSQSLGPGIRLDDDYRYFWSYIPHFIHSPFYVYAYAFGDCLVNALFTRYKEGMPDFEGKYFRMLEAGGTLHHRELLKPFGLDASQPDFWKMGLSIISDMITLLET